MLRGDTSSSKDFFCWQPGLIVAVVRRNNLKGGELNDTVY